ncbi:MAG TPA: integrase core domain-containing protein [Terriglobales bacterium]|nr:integrase core domain-containing protein [Terriglobales bacterium]
MRKSRFSDEQIVAIVRESEREGVTVEQCAKKHGINAEEFAHLREARILIEQWRWEHNTQRPHSSLGYRTPAEVGAEARAAKTSEVHPITPVPLS